MHHFAQFDISESEKTFLLVLARKNIESWVRSEKGVECKESDVPPNLIKKGASFVTLNSKDGLRGCIGSIFPEDPLYVDILKNSRQAALSDHRFLPVSIDELSDLHIEISILTPLEKIHVKNENELIDMLDRDMGLLLKYRDHQATFLPSVWEKLNSKKDFIFHLKNKAGLPGNLQSSEMEYYVYKVVQFAEVKKP